MRLSTEQTLHASLAFSGADLTSVPFTSCPRFSSPEPSFLPPPESLSIFQPQQESLGSCSSERRHSALLCWGPRKGGGGAGQGVFKRLLTHPSPTTWYHIPNFLLRSPAYRYLSRAGRAEKLRRSRGVGRADCWIICKTQRLHRHPGSRQEMLICMPCA